MSNEAVLQDVVYQIFVQDEYNNNWMIGFYSDPNCAVDDINSFISVYPGVKPLESLEPYTSTFGQCIDKELEWEDWDECVGGLMVRGFIFDRKALCEAVCMRG